MWRTSCSPQRNVPRRDVPWLPEAPHCREPRAVQHRDEPATASLCSAGAGYRSDGADASRRPVIERATDDLS
jgi:hypothetical protein